MKSLQITAGVCVIAGSLLFASGCYTRGSVSVGYYDYDCYPGADVYYYPQGGIYYWNEGGRWRSDRHLPGHYDLRAEKHEPFRGQTCQPWTEHHAAPQGNTHPEEHH